MSGLLRSLSLGAAAGGAGTLALNAVTYLDVVVRGRPPSQVPAETVGSMAEAAGVESVAGDDEAAGNRRSGLGALMGYVAGIGTGAAFGLVRARLRSVPMPVAGLGVGAAAMIAANAGAVATGATDPRRWGVSGWVADVVPHVVYGAVTAAAFDRLARR